MILKGSLDNKIVRYPTTSASKIVNGYKTFSIVGGEFAICNDESEIAIQTLLGSCVAVMFYDKFTKFKAINHFLLPQSLSKNDSYRFGLFSLEEMLNTMFKLGVKKENLVAKIAGGSKVLNSDISNIGLKNVEFAREFCSSENIKIVSEHVLGNSGRVLLLGNDFETFIRFVENRSLNESILKHDRDLQLEMQKSKKSQITLF